VEIKGKELSILWEALLKNREVLFAARGLKYGLDFWRVASHAASRAFFCSLCEANCICESCGVAATWRARAHSARAVYSAGGIILADRCNEK